MLHSNVGPWREEGKKEGFVTSCNKKTGYDLEL